MDGVDDIVARGAREDLRERKVADLLGERAPVAAHYVQALLLYHLSNKARLGPSRTWAITSMFTFEYLV